jgi:hypothetical protein
MAFHEPVLYLSFWMAVVALLALIRTGSWVPLVIAGSLALATFLVGLVSRYDGAPARAVAVVWVALIFVINGYQVFFRLKAHGQSRPGSPLIFGSVAVFALVVLYHLIRNFRAQPG